MNKEEILKKSIKENIYGDEREKRIRVNRDAFSAWGVVILGVIMMIIKLWKMEPLADIIALLFSLTAMGSLYEAIKTKKAIHIVCTIVFFLLTIYFFYKFCMGIF